MTKATKKADNNYALLLGDILPFAKTWLLLIVPVCLWFIHDNRFEGFAWRYRIAFVAMVAILGWHLLRRLDPTRQIKLSIRKLSPLVWGLIIIASLAISLSYFLTNLYIYNFLSGRFLVLFCFAGGAAILLWATGSKTPAKYNFYTILLLGGVLYRIVLMKPRIQNNPFSLSWSGESHFYYASLFDAIRIYGKRFPLPIPHPTRYLLHSIPFFLHIDSILFHRMYEVLLWVGITLWGSWLAAKRVLGISKTVLIMLTLYCFLFFYQGAVYYFLMVSVIIMLIGYRKDHHLRTLITVILASIWAGISRINWVPLPALLAVTLYLIDTPISGKKLWDYLRLPLLWGIVGVSTGLLTKQAYILISGNDQSLFNTSLHSPMLWERLLPNSTFEPGILWAILIVCLPLAILWWNYLRTGSGKNVHWVRWMGISAILLVFLGGGLIVSVKIGGGADLHNLDAFLVLFLLVSLSLLSGQMAFDANNPIKNGKFQMRIRNIMIFVALLVPFFYSFAISNYWGSDSPDQSSELRQMQQAIDALKEEPGEILFISERQLLTFGDISGVELVPEYERVTLMEMAMSDNKVYLDEFYDRLANHEYKAIITDSLSIEIKDDTYSFEAENNAWVLRVVIPLLQEYYPAQSWSDGNINFLLPRDQ